MTETGYATQPGGEVACSYHPEVQTRLRCSRCGKPICPRCAVRTPVGLRCPDCAGVRSQRTIRTSPATLVRAAAAALAVGALTTILWYLLPEWKFYLSLLLGFGVAESMAYIARGKRGADLQLVGLAAVTLVMVAVRLALAQRYGISLDQLGSSEPFGVMDGGRPRFGRPSEFLQLTFIPDLLFAVMVYAIVWVRFR